MESEGDTRWREPEVGKCRTSKIFSDLYECLEEHPVHCRYAESIGYGYLCKHPAHKTFAVTTGDAHE